MPAIAVLLYLIAGFMVLLGGARPNLVATGRTWFWNTTWGLVIIFGAWMITNTVLKSLVGDKDISNNWFRIECTATVQQLPPTQRYTCGSLGCVSKSNGEYTDPACQGKCPPAPAQKYGCDTNNQCVTDPDGQHSEPTCNNQCQAAATTGATCPFSGVNLCQPGPTSCPTNACGQYSSAINQAASQISISGLNAAGLIRSIIFNESSCNISAVNQSSCGLMQIQPATANAFKARCGVTANITCSWLTDPANATASICIGAQFLQSLAGGTCGSQIRNIAAGYNGGVTACQQSSDCRGDASCDDGAVRKWECLYDNPEHTACNTGFDETRTYAPRVLACYNKQ